MGLLSNGHVESEPEGCRRGNILIQALENCVGVK